KQEFGKTSTIQWARPTETLNGVNVTRSQRVDVDIGMEPYSTNIHPLENASGEELDRKHAYAV
ncbi:32_t:CDS:1, partial [Acaulospora colombiana]